MVRRVISPGNQNPAGEQCVADGRLHQLENQIADIARVRHPRRAGNIQVLMKLATSVPTIIKVSASREPIEW